MRFLYFLSFTGLWLEVRSRALDSVVNPTNGNDIITAWAEAGYDWWTRVNCANQSHFSEHTCRLVKTLEKKRFRIYSVKPMTENGYDVLFPDGDVRHKGNHSGILILDPFPAARFGHPFLVFLANAGHSVQQCDSKKGFFVGDACLQPLLRTHCSRLINSQRPQSRPSVISHCGEVIFLPLVYSSTDASVQENDQLQCFSNITGFFNECPRLRPKAETNQTACDPITTNRDCGFSENSLEGRCTMSQTCDHAVLLSGGWNRQLSDVSTLQNIRGVKNILQIHGYLRSNIISFYANGQQLTHSDDEEVSYYPATVKNLIRNHIQAICRSDLCADTFFIYLNSPARPDGSSLLWDRPSLSNGLYDDTEIYTAKELLRDVSNCKANRVVIMADQSYGAAFVSAAVARFDYLKNVAIFTSTDEFNWHSPKDRITRSFLKYTEREICLNDFKNSLYKTYKTALFIGSNADLLNSTIIGAPCNSKATSLNDQSIEKYKGCSLNSLV